MKFIQIASTFAPECSTHASQLVLHALDEDGRVWVYVTDEVQRDESGNPKRDPDTDRILYTPPHWERLSNGRKDP